MASKSRFKALGAKLTANFDRPDAQLLERLHGVLQDGAEEMAQLISAEMGAAMVAERRCLFAAGGSAPAPVR